MTIIRIKSGLAVWVLALLAGFACVSPADAESVLRVGGVGSGLGAMRMLAEAFEAVHPGVKIKVFPSLGSAGGIKALATGALDLAISARPLKEEELREGAVAQEYSRTPFVFAANKSVNKTNLTTRELEQIYLGKMLNWPDGSQIRLVLRPEGDSDTRIIMDISPAMAKAVKAAKARPGMIVAVTNQECDLQIAAVNGALGPSTLTEILTEHRNLQLISFNGVRPTVKALADGSYPLVKRHYLVTTAKSPELAHQFARFVFSPQARSLLNKTGNLVPQGN